MNSAVISVVVIGGGYAGINAVKILYKKLKNNKNIEIVMIDKNPFHTLMTELHEVAGGRAGTDSVRISYKKIFGGRKIKLVTDHVKTIDFNSKRIFSENEVYYYDYLIVSAGAEPDFFNVKGIKDSGFTLWSYDDAVIIRNHMENIFVRASRENNPEKRRELLTFVVAGGGFTGIEFAGELLEWKKILCRRNGIQENEVKIYIIEALNRILSILPDSLSRKAAGYIRRKGGEIMLNSEILELKDGELFIKGGKSLKTKTVVWTCGIQGCEFGANLGLTKGTCVTRSCNYDFGLNGRDEKADMYSEGGEYVSGKLGRIMVKGTMQSVEYQNVYICGDLLWYESGGNILPQVVETALQTSAVSANNIIADIAGKEKKNLKPGYHGFMISIGSKYGVAHVMNVSISGFIAIFMKHLINLHYLLGVAGINTIRDYLKHHFLDVKDNRSVIGGHAAVKIRIYWVIILRLFLGAMWLIEGSSKIMNGWLNPGHIYILSTSAQTGASALQTEGSSSELKHGLNISSKLNRDSDSGASATVSNAENIDDQQPSAVSSASLNQPDTAYQKPLLNKPLGIYLWMEKIFISKAPFVFQAAVVLTEILIGLAFIGGLFTFLASIGSIGLCIVFTISSLAGKEILWYIASSIVMLGGAGKGFGLDYWVMPWIKRWWNGTKLAKKTYMYIDEPENRRR